jgi:hypothetical protein
MLPLKRIRRYPNDVIYRLSLITSQASGHSGSSAPFLSVEHYLNMVRSRLGGSWNIKLKSRHFEPSFGVISDRYFQIPAKEKKYRQDG